MNLGALPRVKLGCFPTPLQELPNLSKKLGGPRILIKRDDMTGLAFGGNKTRKLEYLVGKAMNSNASHLVTAAGFQSNWCTQTAAAGAKLGMKVVLIKLGPENGYMPEQYDGNDLLHRLMGAEIITSRLENVSETINNVLEHLKSEGHQPYLLTAAGSTPPGVAGYANCVLELMNQSIELGVNPDYLVHTTGSAGTQAGLVIGAKTFGAGLKIIAATPGMGSSEEQTKNVERLVKETAPFLEVELDLKAEDIIVYDNFGGEGYGHVTEEKLDAIRLLAETEGLFVDPVYTGSSLACLIHLCENGFFKSTDTVVFLHTGGTPALFPYKEPIKAFLDNKTLPWTVPPWSFDE